MAADEIVAELDRALRPLADGDRAAAMAAYMQHRFAFLGVAATPRRAAQRDTVRALSALAGDELLDVADACWDRPEREFQYTACDALRRYVDRLDGSHLPRVERLIRTESWWDTVDLLAAHVVGPLVRSDHSMIDVMDAWIADDDIWIARSAILHQLGARGDTDAERLFTYVDRRAGDTEFFIRKAAGWALREYAKVDPTAVRAYVEDRGARLSGLTRREALKHLR